MTLQHEVDVLLDEHLAASARRLRLPLAVADRVVAIAKRMLFQAEKLQRATLSDADAKDMLRACAEGVQRECKLSSESASHAVQWLHATWYTHRFLWHSAFSMRQQQRHTVTVDLQMVVPPVTSALSEGVDLQTFQRRNVEEEQHATLVQRHGIQQKQAVDEADQLVRRHVDSINALGIDVDDAAAEEGGDEALIQQMAAATMATLEGVARTRIAAVKDAVSFHIDQKKPPTPPVTAPPRPSSKRARSTKPAKKR